MSAVDKTKIIYPAMSSKKTMSDLVEIIYYNNKV